MTILNAENPAHAAAVGRLQAEPIIWLTTVTRSGQPQSTQIRNIASNPHVSLHLEGNGRGGANVIFEGTARLDPAGPGADAMPAYLDKYRGFIDSYGWTPESFAEDYPHRLLVSPTRARIW